MTSGSAAARWVVVVPVKVATAGKTRLSGVLDDRVRAALVRAMALDTVDAALAASRVGHVLVVTADPELRAAAGRFGVVDEPGLGGEGPRAPAASPDSGRAASAVSPLDAAVLAGVAAARSRVPGAAVAMLLGDLPALRPDDLDAALDLAAAVPLGYVADAEGTGTTMLTAARGETPQPRFGAGSAAAHGSVGHVPLAVPGSSSLRRDVDLPADLEEIARLELGVRTAALLARLRG
ncbi:2-phospho-L-lactate guanylyltransferase [Cellulomonas sp. PhB150]|uniref:2-phospho-L-lactate guanylyltransferase n=1 Tax=Cellulomonas sp. PhB150 TaxID=2485188 RepID=UPI000F45FB50|nr:2-phospho-L-lactate guanylyltransferase [Cellulomonas sp. PhB150]ROS28055.1 2-phospho-L-lactate guanylyltransferase [Cellulomonas sp. PhB150]